MKLKLLLNIGSIDARRLGLKHTLEGQTVDVPKPVADELLAKGWAVPPGTDAEDAADGEIAAVPAAPLLTSTQLPADRGAVRPESIVGNPGEAKPAAAASTAKPAAIKPKEPLPDFAAMTKDELRTFATKHGI